MPYLHTAQEWLTQSTLLIQARPTTTRITTKYSLPRAPKPSKESPNAAPPTASAKPPPTSTLTLKTYDPVSGATLKYQTDKAAEVGRLIQIMGRLGRGMAGLEMKDESLVEKVEGEDSAPTPAAGNVSVPAAASGLGGKTAPAQAGTGTGQGGKKGKKKGKK